MRGGEGGMEDVLVRSELGQEEAMQGVAWVWIVLCAVPHWQA